MHEVTFGWMFMKFLHKVRHVRLQWKYSFFFQLGAQIKSYIALNFSSSLGNMCEIPLLLKFGSYNM